MLPGCTTCALLEGLKRSPCRLHATASSACYRSLALYCLSFPRPVARRLPAVSQTVAADRLPLLRCLPRANAPAIFAASRRRLYPKLQCASRPPLQTCWRQCAPYRHCAQWRSMAFRPRAVQQPDNASSFDVGWAMVASSVDAAFTCNQNCKQNADDCMCVSAQSPGIRAGRATQSADLRCRASRGCAAYPALPTLLSSQP